MDALWSGIHTHAMGDSTLGVSGTLGGRLYFDVAPQDPSTMVFPYGNYSQLSDRTEYVMAATNPDGPILYVLWQVEFWSKEATRAQIKALGEAFMSRFDWATFTVTGWRLTKNQRISQTLTKDDIFWRYIIEYETMMQKA